jgi:protein-disulfide isomerase
VKYVRETYPQIEKSYIQTGKLKYAVIDLPLESIHSAAFRGAEIVRCADEQGKYWEMRDRLFSNPQSIADAASHAAALGLDARRLDGCLASGKYAAGIRADMSQARNLGIEGTPSFLLAIPDAASGKMKPIHLITGARPFSSFQSMIDGVLADLK